MSRTFRALALAALAGVVFAPAAAAVPTLYWSYWDDGVDDAGAPGADPLEMKVEPKATPSDLGLWVDAGSTATGNAGELCESGDGDEACGVLFEIQVTGDMDLVAFAPDLPETRYTLSPKRLMVVSVTTGSPLLGPTRVGTLSVATPDVDEVESKATLTRIETVDADLTDRSGAQRLIFVPEPGFLLLLASGVGGLAALGRLRGRA